MPRPRRQALLRATLLVALLSLGAAGPLDPAEVDIATRTLLCDCGCHPQSVHACACGRAETMRGEIAEQIRGGKTGAEVIADYVAKYGESIRIVPKAEGFNLLAWVGPGFGLLAASLGIALVLRRWKRSGSPLVPAGGGAPLDPDDPYLSRLDRELKEYE